tara:strand:+ start:597 stop:917 length:321 start_codon:yes stop_codon:yes gene_type:complete
MRVIINKNKALGYMDIGEANGYLIIDDKNHPWYGKHYNDIDIDVHGGLTYSELVESGDLQCFDELIEGDVGSWMIGFDTCHCGDTTEQWPAEYVRSYAKVAFLLEK